MVDEKLSKEEKISFDEEKEGDPSKVMIDIEEEIRDKSFNGPKCAPPNPQRVINKKEDVHFRSCRSAQQTVSEYSIN